MTQSRIGSSGTVGMMIRMPESLRDRIKAAADAAGRSINSEVVAVLADHYRDMSGALPKDFQERIDKGEHPVRVWADYRGVTSAQLAEMTDLPRTTIATIANGHRYGSVRTLQRIAEALSVTVDDLI